MRHHLHTQVADLFALSAEVYDREGPIGEVDDGTRKRFV
jgi:hypothetical protein